jgi:competence protein ComGC
MKLSFSDQKRYATTLFEALMVVACLLILAALLLPMLALSNHRSARVNCVNNLKQVNLAFRIWEGDNTNQYPMAVSVTNGGAMELIETGNVTAVFQVMN